MSYDSICETCAREKCNARMDGLMSCGMHVSRETNWQRFFGTPEKAAMTLNLDDMSCKYCLFSNYCDACGCLFEGEGRLLEWLEEVAE